jgi:hypothetical protein
MSKVITPTHRRVLLTLALFVGFVVILTTLYGYVGVNMTGASPYKWVLSLFGPVLALFTHMSIFLFLPLSVPLIALLVIGAIYVQTRIAVCIGFVIAWFAIGWYLHDLF